MSVSIDASGIQDLDLYFARFPEVTSEAMSIAINDTARGFALTAARRDITKEVAFPEGYLERPDRLSVTQFATPTRLEAKITARDVPTSLARFAPFGTPVVKKGRNPPSGGITVTVKPGQSRHFSSGFLVSLKNGNVGFAIRLRPGEKVREVKEFQPIVLFRDKSGLPVVYLLYGPSVDQVFQAVSEDISAEVTSELESEFMRQFVRLSGSDK